MSILLIIHKVVSREKTIYSKPSSVQARTWSSVTLSPLPQIHVHTPILQVPVPEIRGAQLPLPAVFPPLAEGTEGLSPLWHALPRLFSSLITLPCGCKGIRASPPQGSLLRLTPSPSLPTAVKCPLPSPADSEAFSVLKAQGPLNLWAPFPGVLASPRNEWPSTPGISGRPYSPPI